MDISPPPAPAQSICMICSQDKSKNPVALEPGCCGKWLHIDCLKLILTAGGTRCPSCSSEFPELLKQLAGVAPAPPQPPAAAQIHAYPVADAVPFFQNMQTQAPAPAPAPAPLPDMFGLSNSRMNIGGPPPPSRHQVRSSFRGVDARALAKNPEDPIAPWNPVIVANMNAKSGDDAAPPSTITTHCIPEVPEILPGPRGNFHAVVNVVAPANSGINSDIQMESRPPMDVVCVLDISGSMGSDRKLINLQHAVDYIRGELSDNDRLSIITFNTASQLVHNLLRMDASKKAVSGSATAALRATGGTSILSGLEAAHLVLSSRENANPITSVFLLTDGIDASNLPEKQRTAHMLKELGSSLFVFGFGNDHDSAHLQAIADAADGMFTFIERSDMVVDAFGGVLGAEQSIFATNIQLHIHAVNGAQIIQVQSGMYVNQISSNGSNATVQFKNLMFGEERDVLVLMNLSPTGGEIPDGQVILTTSVSYRPLSLPTTEPTLESLGSNCVVKRVENISPEAMIRHELVDIQINRLILTRVTKQSMDFADSGNYAQARSVLQEAIHTLRNSSSVGSAKTRAFIQELELTLNDVRGETEFLSAGGRSNMSEKAQVYGRQRMCYAKEASPAVMWQNSASSGQQMKANKSKGI